MSNNEQEQTESVSIQETFPFIADIQRDILPALTRDTYMWVTFHPHIETHYFSSIDHQHIFKFLVKFFKKYKALPTEAQTKDTFARIPITRALADEIEYLYHRPPFEEREIKYIRDEMGTFIKENKIRTATLESIDILETTKDYFAIERKMKEAVNWDAGVNVGVEITDCARRFEEMDKLEGAAYPSPWFGLNHYIGGGFYPKEMFVFLAGSSVGKSIALDNIAGYAWLCGFDVVSITLELSEARKLQRIDSAMLGMSKSQLYENRERIGRFYADRQRGNRLFIKEFPTSRINSDHIEQYLYQLNVYEGLTRPAFIIIDYLDILLPTEQRTGSTYIDQGITGENLRAVAQTYETRLITASQFNRTAVLNNVTVENINEGLIADSWKKICTADTVAALVSSPEKRRNGEIDVKLLKNRNGEKDTIFPLKIAYEHLKITDCNGTARSDAVAEAMYELSLDRRSGLFTPKTGSESGLVAPDGTPVASAQVAMN